MKYLFTIALISTTVFCHSQIYNPDSNNDGVINSVDLLSLLEVYGQPFQTQSFNINPQEVPGNYIDLQNYPGNNSYKLISGDWPKRFVVLPRNLPEGSIVTILDFSGRTFRVYDTPSQQLDDQVELPTGLGEYSGFIIAQFYFFEGQWHRV